MAPKKDQCDSLIPDFICPEDTAGPLEVPPDPPVLPTYSVPPVVPPYTDAPPSCEAPPPNPSLQPPFIPTITDAPPPGTRESLSAIMELKNQRKDTRKGSGQKKPRKRRKMTTTVRLFKSQS
ncbi:proline-rich protein 4-like [Thalassophryne amazonica]|uniref:proline-rich protein 4-like n=1 Tax=Thalassophryne amazonica TaxID=390379 RepID=UPI001470A5E3|nr:proline-rich protein 4-like [Thalassophryne amazonica]